MTIDYSFVIAVKNRQELFNRCLKSVLWQDYPSYEVIVVDYGSEPKVVVPEDRKIRIIRLDPKDNTWNISIALNAGVANSKAENLVLMGCDCIHAPDLLSFVDAIAKRSLLKSRKLQIYWRRFELTSLGQSWLINSEPKEVFQNTPQFLTDQGLGKWGRLNTYGDFLIVKREPVVVIGGFDERMSGWGWQDADMMERLMRQDYQKYWGMQLKLIHQFHFDQQGKNEAHRRNLGISRREKAAGNVIRNGGPQGFAKYRV